MIGMGLDLWRTSAGPDAQALAIARKYNGIFLDPSDLSTMWQDPDGTTPVTAAGQPVGRIVDKSRGVVFVQPTTTSRPVLQAGHIVFDGTDDGLYTAAAVDSSAYKNLTLVLGMRGDELARAQYVVEAGNNYTQAQGRWSVNFGDNSTWGVTAARRNPSNNQYLYDPSPTAGQNLVLAYETDVSAASGISATKNGQALTSGGAANSGTTLTSDVIYVGRRNNASNPFKGGLHALIVIPSNSAIPAFEVGLLQRYAAQRSGVTL